MDENLSRIEPVSIFPQPMSIQSSEHMDLGPDFPNVSDQALFRAANPHDSRSPDYIDQKKRSIGTLQSQPDLQGFVESTPLEVARKRICREEKTSDQEVQPREEMIQSSADEQYLESGLNMKQEDSQDCEKAVKRCVAGEEVTFDYRTTELKDQLRETHDALAEERKEVEALHSKICEEVSGVDRGVIVWGSPFQYAELFFSQPENRLIYKNARHQSNMAEYRQSGSLPDLEIRGMGTLGSASAILCHSSILCAVSSVIKTRLASKLHHGSQLNFENITHKTLIELVGYADTGSIGLDAANVLSVYSAADFLDIGYLISSATTFLSECTEKFDGVSCYKVFRFLGQHDRLKLLIPMYKRRAMEHIAEVLDSVECLADMSSEFLIEVLESDFVDFGPETELIRGLSRWVSMDSSREQYLPDLGSRIRWNDVEHDPSCEDVTAFRSKLKSTGGSISSQPKIGSRNRGLTGGFLLSYGEGTSPLLLDIRSQKIKILPEYPDLVYKNSQHVRFRDVKVAQSDDGALYIVSEFDYMCSDHTPGGFNLLRLNALEHRWDEVLKHQIHQKNDSKWYSAKCYCVFAGKLWLTLYDWKESYSFVECLDLSTAKVELSTRRLKCSVTGVSAGLSSVLFLDKGKVTRFDAKTRTFSDVKVPSDQLRWCHSIEGNSAGQALLYDGSREIVEWWNQLFSSFAGHES